MRLPWRRDPALGARATATAPPTAPAAPPASAPTARDRAAAAAPPPPPPAASRDEAPLGPVEACEILGVSPAASPAQVEQAYRERALQCHPDKVAHLDPDIQALAERKFKRLQAARDLLLGEA